MEELTASESKKLAKAYDIPDEILEKMADDEKRNIMIIRAIEDLVIEKNKRILVFGTTVRHARDIAIILAAKKYHAFCITNDTPPDVREKTIKDFSNDESDAKILCNFGILSMGFNVPKISAVVIARPTKSLGLYSQMVGRATRGVNAGGTANCSIRTVVDSSLQHLIASNVFFYWEDAWKWNEHKLDEGHNDNFDIISSSPKLIESLRASDYKNTTYAVAELVDNSVDARAKHIEIMCMDVKNYGTGRHHLDKIAVLDDGRGMDEDKLRRSLKFGDGKESKPDDLGKFGMGLPKRINISMHTRGSVFMDKYHRECTVYVY